MMDLPTISSDELDHVTGGTHRARHTAHANPNPFGFLDGPYKSLVFGVASNIGGTKLADKMYGSHVTASDRTRAQAAMKQFLVAGNKLPQGVPNLFG